MRTVPKSIAFFALTVLTLSQGQKPGKTQDLISGKNLNIDYCVRDFKKCADIAESASILDVMYQSGDETEKDVLKKTQAKLQEAGSGWNKGYSETIDGKPSIEQATFNFPFIINSQAIIARKNQVVARNKDGNDLIKKQYLISVRGTETNQLADFTADLAALVPGGYTGDAALGFGAYANTIANSKEFDRLEQEILKSIENNEDFEILVTGHSLGGAAATILKARLDDRFPNHKDRIKSITFGAPPSGNDKFNAQYGKNITAVRTKGDLVPALPTIFGAGKIIGDQYELSSDFKAVGERIQETINSSLDDRDVAIKNWDVGKLLSGYFKFVTSPITSVAGSTGQAVGIHVGSYTERERYDAARGENNDWYNFRNDLMNKQISYITQGGSSHIGSASYYLGNSIQDDSLESNASISDRLSRSESPRTQSQQQSSQYIPADSITNLKAPVDIVLKWDQPIRNEILLDLDSHLTGPTSLGTDVPVRFHTRFDAKGSTSLAPFAELYKDVRPDQGTFGPEQTRIQVLQQNGIYRFYVHDYTNRDSTQSKDLSNSGANVGVYNGTGLSTTQARDTLGPAIGAPIPVPTNQGGNVWYVFQLDSKTGILRRVNAPFIYESDRAKVPRIGESR